MIKPTFATINGKRFQLAEPLRQATVLPVLGREREMRLIQAAFLTQPSSGCVPLNVLLLGPPGVGKTALAEEVARRQQLSLYTIQGNDGMVAEELAVSARPSDEGIHKIEYVLSGLASAMYHGGICLIDEIGKLKPNTLATLAPVADHLRTLFSALAGFQLTAHRDFRLIATSNSMDFQSATLPEFVASRLGLRLHLGIPSREVLDEIIRTRFQEIHDQACRFLDAFWNLWLHRFEVLPSPRRLIQTCQLAFQTASLAGRTQVNQDDVEGAINVTS